MFLGFNGRIKQGDRLNEYIFRRDRIGNAKEVEVNDLQEDKKAKFCCPQPIMMPTFITDDAFDKITKRLQKTYHISY